jgi:hypothetical protein
VDAHKLRAAGERGGPERREHAGRWADCERVQPRVLARVAAADVELCAGRVRSPVAERAYGLRPLPVCLRGDNPVSSGGPYGRAKGPGTSAGTFPRGLSPYEEDRGGVLEVVSRGQVQDPQEPPRLS